jgi:hypothetical protein
MGKAKQENSLISRYLLGDDVVSPPCRKSYSDKQMRGFLVSQTQRGMGVPIGPDMQMDVQVPYGSLDCM